MSPVIPYFCGKSHRILNTISGVQIYDLERSQLTDFQYLALLSAFQITAAKSLHGGYYS